MTSERDEARRRMIATRPPGPLPRVDPSVDELVGAALSAEERAELRALCDEAPDEWDIHDYGDRWLVNNSEWGVYLPANHEASARLIAAARTALPRLLDALERSERRLELFEREVEVICATCDLHMDGVFAGAIVQWGECDDCRERLAALNPDAAPPRTGPS